VQNLERLFVSHQELWSSAIEAVGVLDCLMALAGAALATDGSMCRPQLLAPKLDAQGRPAGGVFKATQLRHPAGIAGGACGSFVPNDICLGGDAPGFILLTGPNMGGKSTLLRQVCLAAVLAQVSKGAAGGAAGMGLCGWFKGRVVVACSNHKNPNWRGCTQPAALVSDALHDPGANETYGASVC
jgi:hypothetical protein